MSYTGRPRTPATLSDTLANIAALQASLASDPTAPVASLSEIEAADARRRIAALVATLPAFTGEIEARRRRAVHRLQQEAFVRLSRASGGRLIRTILDDLTRSPVIRLTHKTAAGAPIEITITTQPGIGTAPLLCRVSDDDHMYLRVSQPAAITRPVTGFRTGDDALQLLVLLENLRVDPT